MKRNKKFKPPVKLITAVSMIFLALLFIVGYILRIMTTWDYFRVRDIVTNQPIAIDLSYLKGRNIFDIDLNKESAYLLKYCPEFSRIRLLKVLPARISVDFLERKPIALVRLRKYYFVDDNAVLFYTTGEEQNPDLPVVSGLEKKILAVSAGRQYNIKELTLAINIIKGIGTNRVLRDYKINKIDVANPSNITILIALPLASMDILPSKLPVNSGYLEVRMSDDNVANRIAFLGQVTAEANNNLSNIKYIDLRFKEPVVKFKDAK